MLSVKNILTIAFCGAILFFWLRQIDWRGLWTRTAYTPRHVHRIPVDRHKQVQNTALGIVAIIVYILLLTAPFFLLRHPITRKWTGIGLGLIGGATLLGHGSVWLRHQILAGPSLLGLGRTARTGWYPLFFLPPPFPGPRSELRKNGIFHEGRFFPWGDIASFRWQDYVLLIVLQPGQSRCSHLRIPIGRTSPETVERVLSRHLQDQSR
jgi:hypothetical protein